MEPGPIAPLSAREPRGGTPVVPATCFIAETDVHVALHHAIRREVFVVEQAVFTGDDADHIDGDVATIKVLGFVDDEPAGAVRLYCTVPDGVLWQGDRLAVLPRFRRRHLGAPLVEFAVRTAAQGGGERMTAHVQLPNVRFFEALGWRRSGAVETYVSLPHQPMDFDLRML